MIFATYKKISLIYIIHVYLMIEHVNKVSLPPIHARQFLLTHQNKNNDFIFRICFSSYVSSSSRKFAARLATYHIVPYDYSSTVMTVMLSVHAYRPNPWASE